LKAPWHKERNIGRKKRGERRLSNATEGRGSKISGEKGRGSTHRAARNAPNRKHPEETVKKKGGLIETKKEKAPLRQE